MLLFGLILIARNELLESFFMKTLLISFLQLFFIVSAIFALNTIISRPITMMYSYIVDKSVL